MPDTKNNGGPAFPEIRIRGGDNYNQPMKIYYSGMTLRDYFAAKEIQAMLSACPGKAIVAADGVLHADFGMLAEDAYDIADAMLKAREVRP